MSATRKVTVALEAQLDLQCIRRWYHQFGTGKTARRRLSRIEAALKALVRNPCSYRMWDDRRRVAVIEGHRIVYRVHPDTQDNATAGDVLVVRIYGPGQSSD